MKDLAGTSAFFTGAVSGIGLGIATAMILAARKVMLSEIEGPALAAPVAGRRQADAGVDGGNVGFDQVRDRTPRR